MTYEEVIEILEELGGCCASDKEYKATHIAIEAIQKQIPKKPIYFSLFCYSCPKCYESLRNTEKYCPECGTKIDRGDNK